MDEASEKPRVYKASMELQQKVGKGPLDEVAVKRMQNAIDKNDVDFTPLAKQFLDELNEALTLAEQFPDDDISSFKASLTNPIMQLKANASIFQYTLIGNMASVMLGFLEAITELDKDVIEILRAHHTSLNAIILKKMKGDGGEIGSVMIKELKDACARYYNKKKEK